MTKIIKPLRSGQITIPADFREKLGIEADTLLQISLMHGELVIKPVRTVNTVKGSPWVRELYEAFAPVREKIKESGLSEKETNMAIDKAVKAVRTKHGKSSF